MAWKTAYAQMVAIASGDAFLTLDLSDTTMAPSGTTKYLEYDTLLAAITASIVASAPSTLDTLDEIAAALGDDPNFATTIINLLAGKVGTTGNEMIEGEKTFSDPATFSSNLAIGSTTLNESDIIHLSAYDVETAETATYYYIGRAASGSATSSAVWRVARITISSGVTVWADGDRNFNNIWDNYASLSYS
jgi:hypothetical protein